MCIRELKLAGAPGKLHYLRHGENLKLCVIIDSSHPSISKLHPQGAYLIALCSRNAANDVGGVMYVLEYSTKKSSRIARSSFATGNLAANKT